MSTTQSIISLLKSLNEADREAVFAAFAMDATVASAPSMPKAKEPKAPKEPKKPRANAGVGTAWSAFSCKIQLEHKADVDAVKVEAAVKRAAAKAAGLPAPEDTKGAHLHWCSSYKLVHDAEWQAFKAAWELEHPKGATATLGAADNSDDAVTVVDDEATGVSAAIGGGGASAVSAVSAKPEGKKRGPKKMADMSPEELAAAKAKRAAKKAEKASAGNSAAGSRASSPPKVKDE